MLLTCIKLKLHFINTVPILSQTYNWNPLRKEVQSANRRKNNYKGNMDRDMMGMYRESRVNRRFKKWDTVEEKVFILRGVKRGLKYGVQLIFGINWHLRLQRAV